MRATQFLLGKGVLGRTLDELQRRASIAINMEGITGPRGPRLLYDFNDASSVRDCVIMSDQFMGGLSQSNLDLVSDPNSNFNSNSNSDSDPTSTPRPSSSSSAPSQLQIPRSYARFHGRISTSLPDKNPKIERTGYAAFRTPNQRPTLFGRSVWDIDPYTYLALRIKSDGRAYFVNLQTQSVEKSDLHQHRLFAQYPGQWETILIKWNDFVRTNHGFMVEPQTGLLRQSVLTVGVGLTDRVEGPFELCIDRVWATNGALEEGTVVARSDKMDKTDLKNKKGQKIQW
ncbi:hypothetical protein E4U35_005604 [Claviceps purpurea]|nr:hypothetical protein E4U38_002238 [Claviceps purpurea]KAG6160100.1 hypothetical protein E4U37_001440 [Claviceps purpurea]KAG6166371.1 hypothetical protein E4U51_003595 [Claviceps purpurea]KAG6210267.1 hypothetical protein E4U35_005604 [Claviceps purpurea]KAG6227663.1 hypothetical protein E4U34_005399 [Claviceps purpurea]